MTEVLSFEPLDVRPPIQALEWRFYKYAEVSASGTEKPRLRAMTQQEASMALIAISDHLTVEHEDFHFDTIPAPENAEAYIDASTTFVESISGHTTDAPVAWKADLGTLNAHYDTHTHEVAVKLNPTYHDDQARDMEITGLLVHEKMHETAKDTIHQIVIKKELENGSNVFDVSSAIGMQVVKIMKEGEDFIAEEQGMFLEEAFVEQAAAKWRKQAYPDRPFGNDMWTAEEFPPLPFKYFSSSVPIINGDKYLVESSLVAAGAIAAHTLELLDAYTDVDLFELMLEARKPENHAEAKRNFIQALNAIQPGLYKLLRETPYTLEGFNLTHDAVKADVINGTYFRNKHPIETT